MDSIQTLQHICPAQSLRVIPPEKPGPDWQSPELAAQTAEASNGAAGQPLAVTYYDTLRMSYENHLPEQLNGAAAAIHARLEKVAPKHVEKSHFETRFNQYDTLLKCFVFYVKAFVPAVFSW